MIVQFKKQVERPQSTENPYIADALIVVSEYLGRAPRKKDLWQITGGLSHPGKMPGYGWGISAHHCKRGAMLRKVKGSTCAICYALRGQYVFQNSLDAHARRLECFNNNTDIWIAGMVLLITGAYSPTARAQKYFRWLDSGDIQSDEMLDAFACIAIMCPETKFWLPTREHARISSYIKRRGSIPGNLVIRNSADMIDNLPIDRWHNFPGVAFSTVIDKRESLQGMHMCPASDPTIEANTCAGANCFACFSRETKLVAYHKH